MPRIPAAFISLALIALGAAGPAVAQPVAGQVFTCVNAAGRTLTSDRLIGECMDREQRVLAKDGTLLRIVPPSLTMEERAEKDARERRLAAEKEAKAEAVRRDRLMLQRYPSEAEHLRARDAALDVARAAQRETERRLAELARDRKPLAEEVEFYKGKPLPAKLRQQMDANDGAAAAQRDAQASQKAEMERIAKRYDAELAHLKRLWAGMAPGTLVSMAPTDAELAGAAGKSAKPIKPTAAVAR